MSGAKLHVFGMIISLLLLIVAIIYIFLKFSETDTSLFQKSILQLEAYLPAEATEERAILRAKLKLVAQNLKSGVIERAAIEDFHKSLSRAIQDDRIDSLEFRLLLDNLQLMHPNHSR